MGLIFKKYIENAYCPECKKRYERPVSIRSKYCCPNCAVPLIGSSEYYSNLYYANDFEYYYRLLSTNIKIPIKSKLTLFIDIPYLLLGAIGLIPFFLFLISLFMELPGVAIDKINGSNSSIYYAIKFYFLRIYGNSAYRIPYSGAESVLSRIFKNDLIVNGITILSVYFAIRLIYFMCVLVYEIYKQDKIEFKKRWP